MAGNNRNKTFSNIMTYGGIGLMTTGVVVTLATALLGPGLVASGMASMIGPVAAGGMAIAAIGAASLFYDTFFGASLPAKVPEETPRKARPFMGRVSLKSFDRAAIPVNDQQDDAAAPAARTDKKRHTL